MKLLRLVVSDLHLGSGVRRGELNPFEDFHYDRHFAELLTHYDREVGPDGELELIMNGDIFDLLKIKIGGVWPTEITPEIASEKLQQCLEGHPVFVRSLREFVQKPGRRITYLPGNHDLDMWFTAPQELLRRYVAPGALGEKLRFVTSTDTYHLAEGIQIRHGHQLERIHAVDYNKMTRKRRDGTEVLDLPWGSLWILEVMNPAKEERTYVDRVQPFGRFIVAGLVLDTRFALRFTWRSLMYFLRRRIFTVRAWRERIKFFARLFREEIVALGGFDDHATRAIRKLRGVHTLIVGHSHAPRYRALPGSKILINTGTWMRMINLDLRYLGQDSGLTYALIEYSDEGKPLTSLLRWHGSQQVSEQIFYAD